MGTRYKTIMSFLGWEYECVDQYHFLNHIKKLARQAEGIIISSPTNTHAEYLAQLSEFQIPILCEKPIETDLQKLALCLDHVHRCPVQMMTQYKILDSDGDGDSFYNYYNHGKDGLFWDCIQTIGLARGTVYVDETSPVWMCRLNGRDLSLNEMDRAYITFLQNWKASPRGDLDQIFRMHEKVLEYEKRWKSNRLV